MTDAIVDVAAARGDVDHAGSFTGDNDGTAFGVTAAVDDTMTLSSAGGNLAIGRNLPEDGRVTAGCLLSGQLIERTLVLQADQFASLDHTFKRIPALLFEDLAQRFQFGDVAGPLPFLPAETFAEFGRQTDVFQILFGQMVDGAIIGGFDSHVIQVGIDRHGDVAG